MNTTTRPIRANQTSLGERAVYTIRVTPDERRQMQAIAGFRHWPESEAWRAAMRLFLRENQDLLTVILTAETSNAAD